MNAVNYSYLTFNTYSYCCNDVRMLYGGLFIGLSLVFVNNVVIYMIPRYADLCIYQYHCYRYGRILYNIVSRVNSLVEEISL